MPLIYFYIQNPYTFGYAQSSLDDRGIANITTRVPSLQFKYPNHTAVVVNNLRPSLSDFNTTGVELIKMVMAPSERVFIEQDDTGQLAELSESNAYLPRVSCYHYTRGTTPKRGTSCEPVSAA